MSETSEQRTAFLQMLKQGVNDDDRALANGALNRAMTTFMQRKGQPDSGPYERDDLERVCGKESSVMLLIVEAEFAIAAARVLERERCARIAEETLDVSHPSVGTDIAKRIRTP